MKSLTKLEPNKTVVFNCPFDSTHCIVRSGTVDGSIPSFFNAVLLSYSCDFKVLPDIEKQASVLQTQREVMSRLVKKNWKTTSLHSFHKDFIITIKGIYSLIDAIVEADSTSLQKKPKPLLKIAKHLLYKRNDAGNFELIEKEHALMCLVKDILSIEELEMLAGDLLGHVGNIDEYQEQCILGAGVLLQNNECLKSLPEAKFQIFIDAMSVLLDTVFDEVEFNTFSNCSKHCEDDEAMLEYNGGAIDIALVKQTEDYLKVNIYFIDSDTRLPYVMGEIGTMTLRNSIVLLSLGGEYEAVGVVKTTPMRMMGGKTVRRLLSFDDLLIVRMTRVIMNTASKYITDYIATRKDVEADEKASFIDLVKIEEETDEDFVIPQALVSRTFETMADRSCI